MLPSSETLSSNSVFSSSNALSKYGLFPLAFSTSIIKALVAAGSLVIARKTSKPIMLPDPSQIEFKGASL